MERMDEASADAIHGRTSTQQSPFHAHVNPHALPLPFRNVSQDWEKMLFGSIGLSAEEADQYRSVFAQHEITLNDWDGLTYDLLKEMGIDKVGHRCTPSFLYAHLCVERF